MAQSKQGIEPHAKRDRLKYGKSNARTGYLELQHLYHSNFIDDEAGLLQYYDVDLLVCNKEYRRRPKKGKPVVRKKTYFILHVQVQALNPAAGKKAAMQIASDLRNELNILAVRNISLIKDRKL